MNKAYRVIFNHATQTWTAVAEFAKAKGKTKSLKLSAVATAIAAAATAGTAHAAVADSQIKTDAATGSILISPDNTQGATQVNGFIDQHPGLPTVYGRADTNNRDIGRDGIRVGKAMTLRDGQILIGNDLQNIGYVGDVVVGNRARVGGGGNDSFSTLVGYGTVGAGPSVSLGLGAQADMASIKGSLNGNVASVAIGAYSYTGGNIDGSTAVGAEAFAQRTGSTAIGQQAGVAYDRQNPYKGDAAALGITMAETITFGEGIGGQGGINGVSVGIQSAARSNDSIAIGNSTMTGAHLPASNAAASVAIGNNAAALRQSTIAIGDNAIAGGYQTTNIAALTERVATAQKAVTDAEAEFASAQAVANANASHFNQYLEGRAKANVDTAKLVLARAQEELALANAYATTTTAINAIAIGKNTQALEQNSAAVGAENRVTSQKTYVLGGGVGKNDANANLDGTTVENSVYLGHDSEATALKGAANNSNRQTGATTTAGATAAVDSATVNGVTYNGFAGATPVGVVTVGASGAERRIQNVAAGEISATSTDAINGSQLYHVMKPLTFKANTNLDTEVAGAGIAAADGTQRSMGETLNIIGAKDAIALARNEDAAVAGAYSAKNIQTVVTKNDELQIQIAENPQFKTVQLDTPQITAPADPKAATQPVFQNGGNNAISANDLMNTGWNLQANGAAVDLVNPYNTVNFKGEGVTITPETNGSVSTLTFKVDPIQTGTFAPAPTTADDISNGGKLAAASNPTAPASVQGVVDAVNGSFWKILSANGDADAAPVGDSAVNPSNNVTFRGVGAIEVVEGTGTNDQDYNLNISVKTDNTTIKVNDKGQLEAIAPATATMAAAPTDDPAAPTAGTITAGDNPTALTTAQNVADMINAAAWKATSAKTGSGQNNGSTVELIQAGETVTFEAGNGVTIDQAENKFTFSVKADGTTTEINDKGEIVAKAPATAPVTNVEEGQDKAGSVVAPTAEEGAKLVTAQTLANAINNSGFTLKASAEKGTEEGSTVEQDLIKAGETVEMIAGKNLNVKQEADGKITYATKENVSFTEIKVAAPKEDGSAGDNPITIANNAITGLNSTLPAFNTDPTKTDAPVLNETQLGSAATLNDVLNAGWNLQNNGAAKDFVKPYDTVNFVDGKGTKAVVDVKADGTIADVKYDVDVTQLSAPITNNEDGSLAGPTESPVLADALKAAEDALAALPETATPEEKAAAEKAVQDAQDAITNAGNQLATAQNVADSVNNSFWNINTSQDGANEAKVGDGKVNPSNNVVFNGVGAVQVAAGTTDEGKYTVDFSVATDDTTVEVKDGKIAAKTSTLAAAPTDDPAAPTAGTILPGDAPNALTTAQNVADMINAAAWKATSAAKGGENEGSSVELVNAGDTVTFEADSGIKIVQDAGKFTFSVVAAGSAVDTNEAAATEDAPADAANNTGKIAPKGDATALMNAQNVADAINASGFTLKTGQQESGKNATPDAKELINPGETVTMIAGDNLVVAQEGGQVVYSLNPDIAINSAKVGNADAPITIGTTPEGDNVISGLTNTLAPFNTNPAETKNPTADFTPEKLSSAATLSDVLNAGWNLQNNGAAKDFVKPYDTVNFVDGKGTKAVVDVREDGTIADVKYDVDVTQLSAPITNNADGSVTGPANSTELADALTAAEEALAALPADATPEEKAAAEKAVQDAKDAVNNAGNALATAQNVADAINASGWNVTSGKVGTGEVEGTTNELINPSETVTFQAGDNMMLKQEGNVFTYSVNPNPVFNNVTANQVTVGGTPATQDAPAKAPIVIGTNPEGKNEITGLDTTLPVPAAEQAKPADINESKAATLGDVLNAGWNLKNNGEAKDVVTPYDTVDFVDGNGTKVVVESKDGVSTVKVDIDPTQIAAPVTNVVEGDQAGSVTGPTTAAEEALKAAQDELAALPADASEEAKQAAADKVAAAQNAVNNAGNQLATAQNVANAINNSGWKATSGTVGTGTRDGADATVELINPAETVTFNAGDNLVIEQAGNEFTYSLNKDIAINSAKIGNADAPITIGTTPEGDNVIDGLTTTIAAPTTEVSPADKPAADKLDNAATLGDVLNAGWNLKNNGEARDVVTPYDTVNFVNGNGTTVSVVTTNGTTSDIKVDVKVDGTTVKFDENGNLTAVQPDTLVNGDKVGGNINLVDSDTVSVAQGDNPGDIKFNVNTGGSEVTADGKAAPKAGDENKVATVGDIVNTINGVGFNAKVAQTGTGVGIDKGGDALVNAGDTVTITAGDNIQVTKDGLNYTVETKKDVKFDTVQVGGNEAEGKAPISIGTSPEGKNVVANLDTTIAAPTTANNPADKPTGDALNNAATLGDVLNAGWNLQENGTAKDVVTPYDTVNFKDGNGTKVNITSNGTVSEVKVDVKTANTDTVNLGTDAAGNLVANVNTSPITNAANGSVNAPTNPAALATAGDVANAINGSGFTLTAQGANGSIVNPGETVDMKNTDGNIAITKDAATNDVVYNLSPTINVTNVNAAGTVTAGNLTVAPNGNVDMGGNRIQNVAPGVAPTDAVNVSQLGTAIGNAIAPIQNRIDDLDDNYRAGLAGSAALVNIPQVTRPGANLVGVGVGHFKGQSAIAVGFSSASDNERLIFKISGSANTQGDYSIGSGMGWQW